MAGRTYVAVDLETTGLNAARDRITEVGMVRFSLDGPLDEFTTLVNPGIPIPLQITQITGISDADVQDAPYFDSVRADVEAFLGESELVGQNLGFDLAFLEAAGVRPPGPIFDTLELAAVLEPARPDRSLGALAKRYGVPAPVAHRALADAETTRGVFLAQVQLARALPDDLLRDLVALEGDGGWSPAVLLREIAEARASLVDAAHRRPEPPMPRARPLDLVTTAQPSQDAAAPTPQVLPETPVAREGEALSLSAQALPEQALATLSAGAQHADLFGAFEQRAEQEGMTRAVAETLETGGQLLVEAGTGTGKSLAYLIPVALDALRSGRRVVISTNTLALQEQLLAQDVPALRTLLADVVGTQAAEGLRVAVLKGHGNYLCLRRTLHERSGGGVSALDARLLGRILVWLRETVSGDRAELRMTPPEAALWPRFSAEGSECLSDRNCPFVHDGRCFLLRARRAAEAAHVVVINHALLLSDLAAGGSAVPAADTVVIDEAHHLEDAATQHLGTTISSGMFAELLERAQRRTAQGRDAGLAGAVLAAVEAIDRESAEGAQLRAVASALGPAVQAARDGMDRFFHLLRDFVAAQANGGMLAEQRLRLTRGLRAQPDWSNVEVGWEAAFEPLRAVDGALATLEQDLQAAGEPFEELRADVEALRGSIAQTSEQAGRLLLHHDAATVVWLFVNGRSGEVSVNAAPLRVDDILQSELFSRRRSVILTGATLCTEGSFDFLRERLGLAEAREEHFGSPFDYRRAVRLLIPEDMPEPNNPAYQQSVARALIDLVRACDGRALALFTSHGALRATADAIRAPLEQTGIRVLAQGPDGSAAKVVQALTEDSRSVVLGTATLWEGIDVPGEAVSLLVIARLPFAVPTDPVYAARSELYETPFFNYAVPQAIVRFRQGFGRLIRRRSDRGVVALLDGRITHKGYGSSFLRSLPPTQEDHTSLAQLGTLAAEWLSS